MNTLLSEMFIALTWLGMYYFGSKVVYAICQKKGMKIQEFKIISRSLCAIAIIGLTIIFIVF